MAKELTERQGQILDLKHGARWSLRQIARHLGLHLKTVQESYAAAMSKVGVMGLPDELPTSVDKYEWRRLEEAEFIDSRIRDYMDTYNEARSAGQLRTAVEALNGCHKYMETMIKLQGLSAPEKVNHTISVSQLQDELKIIEGELGRAAIEASRG